MIEKHQKTLKKNKLYQLESRQTVQQKQEEYE